jgi:hypothetical protein
MIKGTLMLSEARFLTLKTGREGTPSHGARLIQNLPSTPHPKGSKHMSNPQGSYHITGLNYNLGLDKGLDR